MWVRSDRQDLLDSLDHRVLQEVPDFKDYQDLRAPQAIQVDHNLQYM